MAGTEAVNFTVRHPRDQVVADCGYDPRRGFFVDLVWVGNPVTYDIAACDYDGVRGALYTLAHWGFFEGDDVIDALEVLRDPRPEEKLPRRLRRVLRVLKRFTSESSE